MSGIHQVDPDSNLAVVLVLRPLRKFFRIYQGQPPSARGLWTVLGSHGHGESWVRPAESIRLKQTKIWPCGWEALPRNDGTNWVCEGKMVPTLEPYNLFFPPLSLPPWVCLNVLEIIPRKSALWEKDDYSYLTLLQGIFSAEWGHRELGRWHYCIPPGWCIMEGCAGPRKDGICGQWGRGS